MTGCHLPVIGWEGLLVYTVYLNGFAEIVPLSPSLGEYPNVMVFLLDMVLYWYIVIDLIKLFTYSILVPFFPKMYPWPFVVRLNSFCFRDECALGLQNAQMWSVCLNYWMLASSFFIFRETWFLNRCPSPNPSVFHGPPALWNRDAPWVKCSTVNFSWKLVCSLFFSWRDLT